MEKIGRKRLLGLLVFGILASAVIATFVIVWLTGLGVVKAVSVVQGFATVTAIGVGGVYAFYKLEVFREFEPHLTITQEPSSWQFGGDYVHVSVNVSLVNRSKVAIRIREASFWMRKVAPLDDKTVVELYLNFLDKPTTNKYVEFPTLEKFEREWGRDEFVIEPGETSTDWYEFIVANRYDTVALVAFFADSTKKSRNPRIGWSAVTLHNINEVKESMS